MLIHYVCNMTRCEKKDAKMEGKRIQTAKRNCSIVPVIHLYECGKRTTVTFEEVRLTRETVHTVTFRMDVLVKKARHL